MNSLHPTLMELNQPQQCGPIGRTMERYLAGWGSASMEEKKALDDCNHKPIIILLLVQSVAFWPVWRWYWARMADGSDEPWGVLALVTGLLITLLRGNKNVQHIAAFKLTLISTLSVVLYILIYPYAPPLLRGGIALLVLSGSLSRCFFARPLQPGLLGLLLLSLPVIASLQFYGGYPMRLLTAHLSAEIISSIGYPVKASGTSLLWFGEVVAVDAPCAGIKMLWSGLFLHFTLIAWNNLTLKMSWLTTSITLSTLFFANVIRATLLFFTESGLIDAPGWAHQAIGLFTFLIVAMMILTIHRQIKVKGTLLTKTSPVRAKKRNSRGEYILYLCAALIPLTLTTQTNTVVDRTFPGWPTEFEGRPLTPIALTEQERGFSRGFPGKIARFSDGHRELIIRYITRPSRKLHPSADCLKGSGYHVTPRPIREDRAGHYWGCVTAMRDNVQLNVCEQISDGAGSSWYDVSSWYWAAILGRSSGPWWAITVAEKRQG